MRPFGSRLTTGYWLLRQGLVTGVVAAVSRIAPCFRQLTNAYIWTITGVVRRPRSVAVGPSSDPFRTTATTHCGPGLIAFIGPDRAVTAAHLAAFYELPAAYLNKQIQALVRAGIADAVPGPS
jgi:hypothetical protein